MNQGWTFPVNSQLPHYFINGKSLCRRWLQSKRFRRLTVSPLNTERAVLAGGQAANILANMGQRFCVDCVRRWYQLVNGNQLPVEPPEPIRLNLRDNELEELFGIELEDREAIGR